MFELKRSADKHFGLLLVVPALAITVSCALPASSQQQKSKWMALPSPEVKAAEKANSAPSSATQAPIQSFSGGHPAAGEQPTAGGNQPAGEQAAPGGQQPSANAGHEHPAGIRRYLPFFHKNRPAQNAANAPNSQNAPKPKNTQGTLPTARPVSSSNSTAGLNPRKLDSEWGDTTEGASHLSFPDSAIPLAPNSLPGYFSGNEVQIVNAVCPGMDSRGKIYRYLQEIGAPLQSDTFKLAHLDIVDCPELAKLFPKRLFYSLRTPYAAAKPPDPLAKRSIIMLDELGNVSSLTEWTELQRLFVSLGLKVEDEKSATEMTKAWLALHKQLFRSEAFALEPSIEPKVVKADNGAISAASQLDAQYEGKKIGHLKILLQFDQTGRLSMVNEESMLPPG